MSRFHGGRVAGYRLPTLFDQFRVIPKLVQQIRREPSDRGLIIEDEYPAMPGHDLASV